MFLGSKVPGLIFGAVRNGETAFAGFGETRDGSGKEPDENSIFRIASVSKVFCGRRPRLAGGRGKVGLTDPLQAHVDAGVTVPEKDGRTIRLIDLVGQTSGLPREVNRPDAPPEDPFSTNTKEVQLAELQKDLTCSRRGPRHSIPTMATTFSARRSPMLPANPMPTSSRSACSTRSA